MITTLTGVFYHELEYSLDNFKVVRHRSRKAAIDFMFVEAAAFLLNSKCTCGIEGERACINCPKKQLSNIAKDRDEFMNLVGYGNDYAEFHGKIVSEDA